MRTLTISFLFFFLCLSNFGQTEIATIKDIYKNRVIMPDEVVPLTNTENGQFAIFFFKGKVINGYLFDQDNKVIDSLESEEKQRNYKQIFGKTILKNGDFVVFMTNKNRRKFASARFSFSEKNVEFKELDLDLQNEKILQTAGFGNKFHVLTITPQTSTINVYRFDDAGSYVKFPIDFSKEIFFNEKQKTSDLYRMLTVNSGIYGLGKSVDLAKIESNNPTTLEIGCNPTKFYIHENKAIISFDANEDITQLVEINLEDMEGKAWQIKKAMDNWAYKEKNSNSFLMENVLYQIVVTKRTIHLRAQNYKSGEIINEHSANIDDKISFKNSSIAQTGGTFDSFREFEDTSTLLRKVMRGKAGITVHRIGQIYHITYGGVIERQVNPGMMMPGFGLPIASIGAVTVFFNPTFFAYQSYTKTKALIVDALFDSKFNHQEGEITENAFQLMETFEQDNRISPAGRTVFRLDNNYILGNYEGFTKTYTLRSF